MSHNLRILLNAFALLETDREDGERQRRNQRLGDAGLIECRDGVD